MCGSSQSQKKNQSQTKGTASAPDSRSGDPQDLTDALKTSSDLEAGGALETGGSSDLTRLDELDYRLLDGWQREFPLTSRPFELIGQRLGLSEADVLSRLSALNDQGAISRIGAVVRPNAAGASTLAAMAVPSARLQEVVQLVNAQEGVNHNYLRENPWNLWFVATGPDKAHLADTLARIRQRSGLPLLDLPMERPFHLDLGFSLSGRPKETHPGPAPAKEAQEAPNLSATDRHLLAAVAQGLPLVPRPYDNLAQLLSLSEPEVLACIDHFCQIKVISRFGVVVRHRKLGWQANAMIVWDLPDDLVVSAGEKLAAWPGITLCYQRRRDPKHWPFNLYAMVHAKSRHDALQIVHSTESMTQLRGRPRDVLFSQRCFKQTGALLSKRRTSP
ncbi:siroheme decarboxylase subunit beta [Rhodovibrionaceae bacterium A322]